MPSVFRASAILSLGFLLASSILAAPTRPMAQAPGYFRYAVGDFVVTALNDGMLELDATRLNGLSADRIAALTAQAFSASPKAVPTSVNAYLVDMGGRRVLVDTGTARCFGDDPNLGLLPDSLHAAGYAPEDIDTILITHLHGDHFCGLATPDGKRAYPHATVWVADEEAAYWLSPEIAAKQPKDRRVAFQQARDAMSPYQAAGMFRTFKPDEMIPPGVKAVATHGHTPGHTSFLFASNGRSLLVWGDIVHVEAVQFSHPEGTFPSDVDQTQAAATRKALLADLARSGGTVAGAHLPFPGIGHVRREANAYAWVPVTYGPLRP